MQLSWWKNPINIHQATPVGVATHRLGTAGLESYKYVTMASTQKESGKIKRANLSICEKQELIKKLESEVSVVRVCDKYKVRNKQLATFGGLKINSQVLR